MNLCFEAAKIRKIERGWNGKEQIKTDFFKEYQ